MGQVSLKDFDESSCKVVHAQIINNYTVVFNSLNDQIVTELSLNSIEEHFYKQNLIRIHKSYLVNTDEVIEIITTDRQFLVKLTSGRLFPVSKRNRQKLLSYLKPII